jgi:hypothetical protein
MFCTSVEVELQGIVVHVRNPGHFLVQFKRDDDWLTRLNQSVNGYCSAAQASLDQSLALCTGLCLISRALYGN